MLFRGLFCTWFNVTNVLLLPGRKRKRHRLSPTKASCNLAPVEEHRNFWNWIFLFIFFIFYDLSCVSLLCLIVSVQLLPVILFAFCFSPLNVNEPMLRLLLEPLKLVLSCRIFFCDFSPISPQTAFLTRTPMPTNTPPHCGGAHKITVGMLSAALMHSGLTQQGLKCSSVWLPMVQATAMQVILSHVQRLEADMSLVLTRLFGNNGEHWWGVCL